MGSGAVRQMVLEKIPEVFINHLMRFWAEKGVILKNEIQVNIPPNVYIGDAEYHVAGVINHSGSRHSCHYTAEVKTVLLQ